MALSEHFSGTQDHDGCTVWAEKPLEELDEVEKNAFDRFVECLRR